LNKGTQILGLDDSLMMRIRPINSKLSDPTYLTINNRKKQQEEGRASSVNWNSDAMTSE
jgi:hypothetical protein